ncbi:hypothetical protein [Sulfurisphaera javensis]|uniref:hypothetical protein n=1 Tax=Sulfurisphaera javensis TaxID=2049879 RepID=UPI0034E872B1
MVRTSRGDKTFLVFIGGYDEGWANSVYSVRIYNGGNAYKAKFTSSIAPKIFNSNSGLVVIPTTAEGNQYWINFRDPVHQVCRNIQLNQAGEEIEELVYESVWQRIVQVFMQAPQEFSKLINVVTFAGIMNYVLQIQAYLLTSFDFIAKHNGTITYNATSNYWILNPSISNYLRSISDMPPSMTLGFNFLRKLEDMFSMPTILALPNKPMTLDYTSEPSFNFVIQLASQVQNGLSNFPIIIGAPVLGSEMCTTECDDSQALIGFVSKQLLPELPAPGSWSEYQYKADLMVPPPRSYSWDDIVAWAQAQGQDVSALNIAADAVAVIQSALEKVAQETGSTVEEWEVVGQDIEIGAETVEKGVENVATEIYNMVKGLF